MLIHIANYFEADRRSATAGEDMALGAVTLASADTAGTGRKLMKVTAAGDMHAGRNGIAFKVSALADAVTSSTATADANLDLGDRIVSIKSGDQIVEVRKGAIVEYDVSLLDASLDPNRAGTLPTVGEAVAINPANALFCAPAVAGAITTSFGVVFGLRGTSKVLIELVA